MSASDETTAIFCTDTPKQIKDKVREGAYGLPAPGLQCAPEFCVPTVCSHSVLPCCVLR